MCRPALPQLVALDLEAPARRELTVEQEADAGREPLGEPGLVEPERGRTPALLVDDRGLDEPQVPAPGRPNLRLPLDRAGDRRLLPGAQLGEPHRLRPVEMRARDVLDEILERLDAKGREPLGDLRPDAGERFHGELRMTPLAPFEGVLVHASEAGLLEAPSQERGQNEPSIGEGPDGTHPFSPAPRGPRLAGPRFPLWGTGGPSTNAIEARRTCLTRKRADFVPKNPRLALAVPVVELLDPTHDAEAAERDLARARVVRHVVRLPRSVREQDERLVARAKGVRDLRRGRTRDDAAGPYRVLLVAR